MRSIIIALLIALFVVSVASASPFTGKKQATAKQQNVTEFQDTASFFAVPYSKMLRQVNKAQRTMRAKMTALGREIKQNPTGNAFWMFLLFSFLYGVVHAIGPGHGKSIVFSYFLGRKGTIMKGVLMGHLLTAVHTLSATVVVLGAYYLLNLKGSRALSSASQPLQATSYYLIIGLGIFIFIHALYELYSKFSKKQAPNRTADNRGIVTVSIVSGLVPCPGAAILLSFALGLDLLTTGLLGALFFTLGMGITTSMFGIASIHSRKALMYVAGKSSTAVALLHTSLGLIAGVVIITTGWMLLQSLRML